MNFHCTYIFEHFSEKCSRIEAWQSQVDHLEKKQSIDISRIHESDSITLFEEVYPDVPKPCPACDRNGKVIELCSRKVLMPRQKNAFHTCGIEILNFTDNRTYPSINLHKWKRGENDFLKCIYPVTLLEYCTQLFNEFFSLQLAPKTIENRCKALGLKKIACPGQDHEEQISKFITEFKNRIPVAKRIYKYKNYISLHEDVTDFFTFNPPKRTLEKCKALFFLKFQSRMIQVEGMSGRVFVDLDKCLLNWFQNFWTVGKDRLICELFHVMQSGQCTKTDVVDTFNAALHLNLHFLDLQKRMQVLTQNFLLRWHTPDENANHPEPAENLNSNDGIIGDDEEGTQIDFDKFISSVFD